MSERFTFLQLLLSTGAPQTLDERLTFDKLMSLSDPKRITRAGTVRVPPMKFDAFQDRNAFYFNVKSSPSTTGLRHKGVVTCFKPKNPNTPLEKCECEVDCGCQDYRYKWAWANKQRGSGKVGPQSVNQAWNKAPRKTNPTGRPGLCKHIIATRDWIYGQFHSFSSDRPFDTTTSKLDKLVRQATTRWQNMPAEIEKAKERDARIKQGQLELAKRRALTAPPPEPPRASRTPTKPAAAPRASSTTKPSPTTRASAPSARPSPRTTPEESNVVSSMQKLALVEEVDALITGQAGLPQLRRATTDTDDKDGSEVMDMLRELRDLVRHLAGEDLPADLVASEIENEDEQPGIPVDAVKARKEN